MAPVVDNFFYSCTDPRSLCETPEPVFAAAKGTCNATTGICECPPNFNGNDIFAKWNDCHIKVDQRIALESTCLAIVAAMTLGAILGVFRLLFHWGIIYWKTDSFVDLTQKRRETMGGLGDQSPKLVLSTETIPLASEGPNTTSIGSPTIPTSPTSPTAPKRRPTIQSLLPSVDIAELQAPRPNARTNTFQQLVAERKRRRNTLILMLTWILFGISAIVFMVQRLRFFHLSQDNGVMLFFLAMMMTTVLGGLWMITYTWFSNLPSLRMFATMFPNVPGISICKRPLLLKSWMLLNLASVALCSFIVLFIIPMVDATRVDASMWRTSMIILAVHIASFAATQSLISLVLVRLFWALSHTSPESNNNKGISRGEYTVRLMLSLTLVFGPVFTAFIFFMGFHPIGLRYSFFFLTILLGGGGFSGMIATYVFVFRMGSRKRERKNSMAVSSHSPGLPSSKKSFKRVSVEDPPVSPIISLAQ